MTDQNAIPTVFLMFKTTNILPKCHTHGIFNVKMTNILPKCHAYGIFNVHPYPLHWVRVDTTITSLIKLLQIIPFDRADQFFGVRPVGGVPHGFKAVSPLTVVSTVFFELLIAAL